MKWKDLFEKWQVGKIKLNLKFAELEFQPNAEDEIAAWEMYVELITRVTTQKLMPEEGDEKTALESIYSIFAITRNNLKIHGRKCQEFTRLAIIVLNQIVRPFTAKWHKMSIENSFNNPDKCLLFRQELEILQYDLRLYTSLLAEMAKVEDLSMCDWR